MIIEHHLPVDDIPPPPAACGSIEEMAKMWDVFQIGRDQPIALRALPSPLAAADHAINLCFTANRFPEIEARQAAFMDAAINLNDSGYNIYTTLNPVSPEFGAVEASRAVADRDIAHRGLLLIDLDRAGMTKEPATDAELDLMFPIAAAIASYVADQHPYFENHHRIMSGNGVHLLVPLANVPADENSKIVCQRMLQVLASTFDTTDVKVDTAVFNAGRITKVPGTIARKGIESCDRPYRMARFL